MIVYYTVITTLSHFSSLNLLFSIRLWLCCGRSPNIITRLINQPLTIVVCVETSAPQPTIRPTDSAVKRYRSTERPDRTQYVFRVKTRANVLFKTWNRRTRRGAAQLSAIDPSVRDEWTDDTVLFPLERLLADFLFRKNVLIHCTERTIDAPRSERSIPDRLGAIYQSQGANRAHR